MFGNLSQGSLIHVLSLNDGVKYNVGTIETISFSNNTQYNNYQSLGNIQNMGSFLTFKVNLNGKSTTIEGVPANSSVSSTNSFIVTDNKDAMVTQVENLLQNSKNVLSNIDKYKSNIKECEAVLKQINPAFAKEADRDDAISKLNSRVDNLTNDVSEVLRLLRTNNKNK